MSVVKQISVYNGSSWDTDDIGAKASNITTASTYVGKTNVEDVLSSLLPSSTLTKSKVLTSNASGKITASSIDANKLTYLSKVRSDIQDQIDNISSSGGNSGASSAAVEEINTKIGDVSRLETTNKVVTEAINQIVGTVGTISDNLTTLNSSVTSINNKIAKIGTGKLNTNSTTLIGAINQIKAGLDNSYKGEIRDVLYQPSSTACLDIDAIIILSRGSDSTAVDIQEDYDYLDIYFRHSGMDQRQLFSRISTTSNHYWLQTFYFQEVDSSTKNQYNNYTPTKSVSLYSLVLHTVEGHPNQLQVYKDGIWRWKGGTSDKGELKKLSSNDQYIVITRIEGVKR